MLAYLEIPKSTYFYTVKTFTKDNKNVDIENKIKEIFDENKGRYGYRRIVLALANKGIKVNHKKVKRIMKDKGLFGKHPKKKYHSYKGEVGKIADNIINRDFTTTRANQKWTTDVTEFAISEGKLYVSPILDMYGSEIVSVNISRHPNFYQIIDMLNQAFERNENLEGLIFHSDQGWQYQMRQYQEKLKEKGIIQSMSRKGNCLDNSIMENFFGLMKNEMFYGREHEFHSLEQLEKEIYEYIEYYNKERIKTKLKGLSPYFYRQQSLNNLVLI